MLPPEVWACHRRAAPRLPGGEAGHRSRGRLA